MVVWCGKFRLGTMRVAPIQPWAGLMTRSPNCFRDIDCSADGVSCAVLHREARLRVVNHTFKLKISVVHPTNTAYSPAYRPKRIRRYGSPVRNRSVAFISNVDDAKVGVGAHSVADDYGKRDVATV